MDDRRELLIEIGTEELPPGSLNRLAESLYNAMAQQLTGQGFAFDAEASRHYAAPRRLAVRIAALQAMQADRSETRMGPAVAAAFDAEGQPTQAAMGFARSVGVSVEDLSRIETDKGERLGIERKIAGQPVADLLQSMLHKAVDALPIAKAMRWSDLEETFVRPVHWVVVLLDDQVIPGSFLGQPFGQQTRGHRFHHPDPVQIDHASEYPACLQAASVMVDATLRRQRIVDQATACAASHQAEAVMEPALLDEVTALVEWPVVVSGSFDEEFLEVPHQALISSMQNHQKFFPLVDGNGALLPRFLATANIQSTNPDAIVKGLERVIRPRLADARFFWMQDLKTPLEALIPRLSTVVYQKALGTLADKADRVSRLGLEIAGHIDCSSEYVERAAALYKCDLLTDMVGEFPELQGVMGYHYAREHGEADAVAVAIRDHYLPKLAGDVLPDDPTAIVLALAERFDTLCGIFAAGMKPSGNRDPFGLRRAANGILRMAVELSLPLDIAQCTRDALTLISEQIEGAVEQQDTVVAFIFERLRSYYLALSFTQEQFNAVHALGVSTLTDFDARIRACQAFVNQDQPTAQSLAAANKRIGNILRKAADDAPTGSEAVDASLLTEPAELALQAALEAATEATRPLLEQAAYQMVLAELSTLREPIDAFFDQVMVMDEDPALRANRLTLLARIKQQFDAIADIAMLVTE